MCTQALALELLDDALNAAVLLDQAVHQARHFGAYQAPDHSIKKSHVRCPRHYMRCVRGLVEGVDTLPRS